MHHFATASLLAIACLLLGLTTARGQDPAAVAPAAAGSRHGPPVLLKLDDLMWRGSDPRTRTVHPRWDTVTTFLEGKRLKASYGIITESLADDCPTYLQWLKARRDKGLVEFWNHGYLNSFKADPAQGRVGQFVGTPAAEQREYLAKGQRLFQEKLGIKMHAFGPHVCQVDATTFQVLQDLPEITMVWFYGPPYYEAVKQVKTTCFIFERRMNIEVPLFVPNPVDIQQKYEAFGSKLPYIALQGHPAQWDEARFANFVKIVEYLADQGCHFMTPSEYLATVRPAAASTPLR